MRSVEYRSDIDGLRAVAIMLVVLYHAKIPFFEGGFLGVDVFFVISGFVITRLLLAEMTQGSFSLTAFYMRRARRLLPALWCMMCVVLLVGAMMMSPLYVVALAKNMLATLWYSANLYLWHEQTDYFHASMAFWPLMHTWSLAIEEQFYLLFPLLLLVVMRVPVGVRVALFTIAMALSCWGFLDRQGHAAFYLPQLRAWELLLGVVAASGESLAVRVKRCLPWFAAVGVVMLAYALYEAGLRTVKLYPRDTLLACAGSMLMIVGGISQRGMVYWLLSRSFMVSLGGMSYSLYLWHWPVLAFAHYYYLNGLSAIQTAVVLQVVFVLAFLSYQYIERPFREKREGVWASTPLGWRMVQGFLLLNIAVLGVWNYAVMASPELSREERIQQSRALMNPYQSQCNLSATQNNDIPIAPCVMGKKSLFGAYQVLLMGDSQADQLAPLLDVLGRDSGVGVRQATRFGCLPLTGLPQGAIEKDCHDFVHALLAQLDQNKTIRTVVLAGAWNGALQAQYLTPQQLEVALRTTMDWFHRRHIQVLWVQQIPAAAHNGDFESCVQRLLRHGHRQAVEDCTNVQSAQESVRVAHDIAKRVVAEFPLMQVYDPFSFFCAKECRYFDDNGLFYRDNTHLTLHGALMLKAHVLPSWRAFLKGDAYERESR